MNLKIVLIGFILLQSLDPDAVFAARISNQKCTNYRNMLPRIFEEFKETDEDAALKEFPFMARIEIGEDDNTHMNGILISENFVLTLASRAHGNHVILGDLNMATTNDDEHTQKFEIIAEFQHPKYVEDSPFDLKLLKLNESVKFDEYVRPACLPQSQSEISHRFYEVGWSRTNVRENKLLHKVKLYQISNDFCKDRFKWIAHQQPMMKRLDEQIIFCATSVDGDRDMCLEFFGAALLNRDRNLSSVDEVIGLATTNTGCEDTYPTVFVRISKSLNWIETIVWPDDTSMEDVTTTQASIIVPTTHKPFKNMSMISINITTSRNNLIFISISITLAILAVIACIIIVTYQMRKSTQDVSVSIHMRD
ncbi:serine protease persephone-like [Bradysia coprophila]|uniref:serine protease persephone-like n=1 Tax=Bradysia coprophila TaxID=38358 RepID=UPI00187D9EA1|nr:serine protease persephone-like [Bradysia coprophila]